MEAINSSDYASLGDRVSESYDTLDMTNIYVQGGHLDHENKIEKTETGRNTLIAKVKFSKRRIFTGVVVTLTVLFGIAFAVMVYMFVSANKAGNIGGTGYCPKYTANSTVVNTTGSNHGDIIELVCDEKSKLIGPHVITCLSTGKWSAISYCKSRMCSNFQVPDNVKLESEISSASVGAKISVSCNEGFVQTGNSTVVCCLSNETWSGSPACEAADCGVPMSVPNAGIHGLVKTTINNTFVVKCLEGYKMSGSNTVRCKPSGHWDVMPTCNKVSCGVPTIPSNGSISHISGTLFQATASLKCDLGFFIRGDPVVNCLANGSWSNIPTCQENVFPTDCYDIKTMNIGSTTGVYGIHLWRTRQYLEVFCEIDIAGGGWTVFQHRFDGSENFNRSFESYTKGFGNVSGEYWLGLENIYELANRTSDLRIQLSQKDRNETYQIYHEFSLKAAPDYSFMYSSSNGTAGNGLRYSRPFSTYDNEQDTHSIVHCAEHFGGGWWYESCRGVDLNAPICDSDSKCWRYHAYFGGKSSPLKTSMMMLRRV